MELPIELKQALDIGLGAVSLLLWLRQGKVNKAQLALDEQQTKATQDLTTMVRDHDDRIAKLENEHITLNSRRRKGTRARA